jgi:hypothetical protein
MMKMVNEYLSPEEAEARSPYAQKPSNAGQETLRAEAVAGQQVGFRGSYGGASGQAAQNYETIQKNKQAEQKAQQQKQQQQSQQNQQVQMMKYMGWERDQQAAAVGNSRTFLENLNSRAGYTAPSSLGDSETVRRLNAIPGDVDRNAALGTVLEQQRKEAELTPGTKDDQYYAGELAKWHENFIEKSSEYHHETLDTGVQQRANPWENQGDIALAILKGGNPKDFTPDKYGFQPNVQETLNRLPGGQGIQENAWQVAKSGQPVQTDFKPAIDYLNSQSGKYGVYGNLYGGVKDTNTPAVVVTANRNAGTTPFNPVLFEASLKRPFVSSSVSSPSGNDWNPFVASAAEPIGYISEGWQVPGQTKTIPPTGEIDVFGNKVVIPGISPIIALFQQPISVSTETRPSITEKTPFASAFGDNFQFKVATDINKLDAAPWIASKGEVAVGSPIYSEPVAVGVPTVTTRFNPDTGVTETISEQKYNQGVTQKYEQWDMTKQTVNPVVTTFTPNKSAFDVMVSPITTPFEQANTKIRSYLPSPEIGEQAARFASLTNPIMAPTTLASIFTEKFNPEQASNARAVEGLVGLRGQYTQFYEQPLLMPASLALAAGYGGVWRGATAASGSVRAATAERVISQGGKWRLAEQGGSFVMDSIPKAMVGLYGISVAERSTSGFTDFTPETVITKSKGIVMQEAVPMGYGFNFGYNAPGQVVKSAKMTQLDYLSMKQEAQAQNLANIPTMGRPGIGEIKYTPRDYLSFKVGKLAVETQGRASILGEDMMNAYVKAKVTGIPDVQVAAQNAVYSTYGKVYQALGHGEYSPSLPRSSEPSIPPTPKTPGDVIQRNLPTSRRGTKTVGGSISGGLRPERSLKSMGITEPSTGSKSSGGVSIGRKSDFRNAPRGSMKPMTDIKQSAILLPQEQQMPMMERPSQTSQPMLITPERVSQPQSFDYDILQVQQPETRQGVINGVIPSFMSSQVIGQRQTQETIQTQEPMKIQESGRLSQFGQIMRDIQQQDRSILSKSDTANDQIYSNIQTQTPSVISGQKSWQDVVPIQTTRSTQIQTPWTETGWRITTTPGTPIIPVLPAFPGGYGGSGGRQGRRNWSTVFPVGLDISTFGRSRPTLNREGTYGVPRMPRQPAPKGWKPTLPKMPKMPKAPRRKLK